MDGQQEGSVSKADEGMEQHQSAACPTMDAGAGATSNSGSSLPSHQEPSILMLLVPYSEALQRLVQHAGQGPALAAWHFLLDYPQVGAELRKESRSSRVCH